MECPKKVLTERQLRRLESKTTTNANELLHEARILFDNGRFARAYALAHLASEELAKAILVAAKVRSVARGETQDWGDFSRRVRDHSGKILQFSALRYFSDPSADHGNARRIWGAARRRSSVFAKNTLKNRSLYAGWNRHRIYAPTDVIPRSLALAMIQDVGRAAELLQRAVEPDRSVDFDVRLWARIFALLPGRSRRG